MYAVVKIFTSASLISYFCACTCTNKSRKLYVRNLCWRVKLYNKISPPSLIFNAILCLLFCYNKCRKNCCYRNLTVFFSFQVLVEFDGVSWKDRRWIKLYQECQYFAVEKCVVWAPISDVIGEDNICAPSDQSDDALYVPALVCENETTLSWINFPSSWIISYMYVCAISSLNACVLLRCRISRFWSTSRLEVATRNAKLSSHFVNDDYRSSTRVESALIRWVWYHIVVVLVTSMVVRCPCRRRHTCFVCDLPVHTLHSTQNRVNLVQTTFSRARCSVQFPVVVGGWL